MQGMLIQDLSAPAEQSRPLRGKGAKDTPEQSFGAVLGTVNPRSHAGEKRAAAAAQKAEADGQGATECADTPLPEAGVQEENAPFFMAALEGQSAGFLQPSARAERVAAAERLQQLIGRWLQGQQQGVDSDAPAPVVDPSVAAAAQEAMATLQQVVEAMQEAQQQEPELSEEQCENLRQLMAAMQQLKPSPEAVAGSAQTAAAETRIDEVSPLSPDTRKILVGQEMAAVAGVEGTAEQAELVAPTAGAEPVKPASALQDSTMPPVPAGGLQEEQMAKIAIPRQRGAESQERPLKPGSAPAGEEAKLQQTEAKLQQTEAKLQQTEAKLQQAEAKLQQAEAKPVQTEAKPVQAEAKSQHAEAKALQAARVLSESQPARSEAKSGATVEVPPLDATTEKPGLDQDKLAAMLEKAGATGAKSQIPIHGGNPLLQPVQNDSHPLAPGQRMMQLPSGQQLPEGQLVDQVVTHLAGSQDGESGRMRLRLHPAELGSLRLDLIVEGDRVRAHLQAQSQQVQEVLDRHLPMLRDALQQQGLKVDEFRVDVQTSQEQAREQAQAWQQQNQQGRSSRSPRRGDEWPQDVEIPLEQLLQQTPGGISLRV